MVNKDPNVARAERLYRSLSTGEVTLRRNHEHHDVDLDLAVCRDVADTLATVTSGWRCFHCGEVFLTNRDAEDHFGPCDGEVPACIQMLTETEKAIVEDRREWRNECLKARDRNEQLEYSASSEAASLLSLFGTMDLSKVQLEYQRMRDSLRAQGNLMAFLIRHNMAEAATAFTKYDPLLISPEEYLEGLDRLNPPRTKLSEIQRPRTAGEE